jgi:hypothetical protein
MGLLFHSVHMTFIRTLIGPQVILQPVYDDSSFPMLVYRPNMLVLYVYDMLKVSMGSRSYAI